MPPAYSLHVRGTHTDVGPKRRLLDRGGMVGVRSSVAVGNTGLFAPFTKHGNGIWTAVRPAVVELVPAGHSDQAGAHDLQIIGANMADRPPWAWPRHS